MMKQYLSKITYTVLELEEVLHIIHVRTKSVLSRRNEPSAVLQGGSQRSGKSMALGWRDLGLNQVSIPPELCDLGQGALASVFIPVK